MFFGLVFAAFFPDVLFRSGTFYRRDVMGHFFPIWQVAAESIKSGTLPLWNPLGGLGAPFFCNFQTGVFYPPALILLLPDYARAFNILLVAHLVWAACGLYAWLRDEREGFSIAVIGGFMYALNGYLMSSLSNPISLLSASYLPWVLWSARRALRSRQWGWTGVAALLIALQLLAGEPAVVWASVLATAVWAACEAWGWGDSSDNKPIHHLAARWTVMVALAAGLTAFKSLLFAEFVALSNRSQMALNTSGVWSLEWKDIISLIVPYVSDVDMYLRDYWQRQSFIENPYTGVTVWILAVAGLVQRRGDRQRGFWLILGFIGAILSLGVHTPLFEILRNILPGLAPIRYPSRFLFIPAFVICLLAAKGLSGIAQGPCRPRRAGDRIQAFAGLMLLAGIIACFEIPQTSGLATALGDFGRERFGEVMKKYYDASAFYEVASTLVHNAKRSALFAVLTVWGLVYFARFGINRKFRMIYLGLLVLADLTGANVYEPRLNIHEVTAPSSFVKEVQKSPGVFRVMATPRLRKSLEVVYDGNAADLMNELSNRFLPNHLMRYGLHNAFGYDSLTLRWVADIHAALMGVNPEHPALLNMLNVRYLASPGAELPKSFEWMRTDGDLSLFRNTQALERAFFVERIRLVESEEAMARLLKSSEFNPAEEMLLYAAPREPADPARASGDLDTSRAEVKAIRFLDMNRMEIDVKAPRGGWLFVSEAYYPGWKARVDSREVPLYRANHAFRGLWVPARSERVMLAYEPRLFGLGLGISLMTALLMIVYYVRLLFKNRVSIG